MERLSRYCLATAAILVLGLSIACERRGASSRSIGIDSATDQTQQQSVEIAKGSLNSEEWIDLPFLGKIKTRRESSRPVTWFTKEKREISFPFNFWITEKRMWVRAEYVGPGDQYPEASTEVLTRWYNGGGQTITGLPDKEVMSVEKALTTLAEGFDLNTASRIVIEHVLLTYNSEMEPEGALIVRVWGVEVGHPGDPIPRFRCIILPKSDLVLRDNRL